MKLPVRRGEAVLFLVVLAVFGLFSLLGIDWHHDGLMLKTAADIADGQVMFRDTFNQYGALTVFLQALFVKLFGVEVIVIKFQTVLFYGLAAVWLDRLGRMMLADRFRYVTLILFLGMAPFYEVTFHPWSSVYALFFMLLAEERMILFLREGRTRELVWAGLATAFAFGCRQPCGMVIAFAALIVLGLWTFLREDRTRPVGRAWAAFGLGCAAPLAVFALYLTLTGAWPDYLIQCFSHTARFAARRFGDSWADASAVLFPFASFFWVFPLVSLWLLWYSLHRAAREEGAQPGRFLPVVAMCVYGLASWHQFFPVPCLRHLYWGSVPMMPVLCYVVQLAWERADWKREKRIALTCLLLAVPFLGVGYRMFCGAMRLYYLPGRVTSDAPGVRGLLIFKSEARMLAEARALFASLPPELQARPFLNYTADGFFALLFPDRRNPHPMIVNWEKGSAYRDYAARIEEIVRERQPVILSEQAPAPFPGYRVYGGFRRDFPPSDFYLNVPRRAE